MLKLYMMIKFLGNFGDIPIILGEKYLDFICLGLGRDLSYKLHLFMKEGQVNYWINCR